MDIYFKYISETKVKSQKDEKPVSGRIQLLLKKIDRYIITLHSRVLKMEKNCKAYIAKAQGISTFDTIPNSTKPHAF